ncbi:hypothetical protein N9164_12975 [Draconibacterium sp.]|nr:hypothetical protein [Draconibacterium sp.]
MLRKTSHIILSALLLFATVGLAISKHYCGGDLVSTSFFKEAKSCCGDSDCCHNESAFFHLDEDYSLASVAEVTQSAEFELVDFVIQVYNFNATETEETEDLFFADSPPPPKIQTALSQRQTYLL